MKKTAAKEITKYGSMGIPLKYIEKNIEDEKIRNETMIKDTKDFVCNWMRLKSKFFCIDLSLKIKHFTHFCQNKKNN